MERAILLFFRAMLLTVAMLLPARGQGIPAARTVVERSVAFHDPQGSWPTYEATLRITLTRPDGPPLPSLVTIDRPNETVLVLQDRDSVELLQGLQHGEPYVEVNGVPGATEEEVRSYNLSTNRITYLHNYYLYLYGIPMKLLEDSATQLDPKVVRTNFHGRDVYRVGVSYGEPWAQHDWAFYFDTETYAMVAYQFWRQSPETDGEYILCEGLETIAGIRHPKVRYWYMNVDGKHIATDTLLPENSEAP